MGRELRMVPKDWVHPKKQDGEYHPMFETSYKEAMSEWIGNNLLWLEGKHPDQISGNGSKYAFYAQWSDSPPNVDYYNTFYDPKDKSLCTHYQLYEDTTEGTPKSPVFATIDEVAEYAAVNCTTFADYTATKEQWLAMFGVGQVSHTQGNIIFI